ncbi:hypothetical protein MKX03_037743 [Papaver bracteatum]|nr:hypothetical protein MKX03_037743 [Papaver bracteatum]
MTRPVTTGAELQGKISAMIVCWLLGNGSLFVWNSMLTAEDYYLTLFPVDLATSGDGGLATYIGLCFIVVLFGLGDGCVEGGMLGDLSLMFPEFIQSFLICGAIMFLVISALFELLCLLLYAFVFAKIPVVKYYRSKAASEGSKTVVADLASAGVKIQENEMSEEGLVERLSRMQLLLENKDYTIIAFLVSVLTYSIFPGFLAEDTGKHGLGTWYALVLLAMFNALDLLGRYIPMVESLKLESRRGLMIATVSRFALVPAFYFTAKYGDQGWMILLTSLLGLSHGYLTVCYFIVAPQGYKGPEQNALGNLLTIFVLGGLVIGIALDWLWLIGKGW